MLWMSRSFSLTQHSSRMYLGDAEATMARTTTSDGKIALGPICPPLSQQK